MVTHFVGFKTLQQYMMAIEIFGMPAYIHERWDVRAEQEYAEGDTIIYANGTPERIQDHPEYKERHMR